MGIFQIITLVISLIAVIISIISLITSNKTQKKQIELQRSQSKLAEHQLNLLKEEEAEKQKAKIHVSYYGNRFLIKNIGQADATNVRFNIESTEGKNSPLVKDDFESKIPIDKLIPGSEIFLHAAITFDTGTNFKASWSWKNPDGTSDSKESFITC